MCQRGNSPLAVGNVYVLSTMDKFQLSMIEYNIYRKSASCLKNLGKSITICAEIYWYITKRYCVLSDGACGDGRAFVP